MGLWSKAICQRYLHLRISVIALCSTYQSLSSLKPSCVRAVIISTFCMISSLFIIIPRCYTVISDHHITVCYDFITEPRCCAVISDHHITVSHHFITEPRCYAMIQDYHITVSNDFITEPRCSVMLWSQTIISLYLIISSSRSNDAITWNWASYPRSFLLLVLLLVLLILLHSF